MKGLVLRGSRNVFTVLAEEDAAPDLLRGKSPDKMPVLECRLKGKVLKGAESYYNPLAPGDRVTMEEDPLCPGTAQITAVEDRSTILTRFNQKGQKSQILAANIDLLFCVTSPASPPFRPRFLDRLLVQAEAAGIPPVILCNKSDLLESAEAETGTEERFADYERIGYRVLRLSAKTGQGLDQLRSLMAGKSSALLGQSGVGKSSLINALDTSLAMRTGTMNEKYDRGNHTTTLSVMLELPGLGAVDPAAVNPPVHSARTYVIDTPGIRRMVPDGVKPEELIYYMKEFAELAGRCTYGHSCSHRTEQGCKILEAAAAGLIHKDRYESFLRIGDELAGL
ncbi:putative ribosome biogenesis GTPase RsgA [Spirochaetia bacterium]|nr:putative ribosome biogenesis GTPase RsgA [Spirochaetia bacterium]